MKQFLQSLKEDQTKIENILLTQANLLRQTNKGSCTPVRMKLGISSELKRRRDLLQRIDDIRVMRIEVERRLETPFRLHITRMTDTIRQYSDVDFSQP